MNLCLEEKLMNSVRDFFIISVFIILIICIIFRFPHKYLINWLAPKIESRFKVLRNSIGSRFETLRFVAGEPIGLAGLLIAIILSIAMVYFFLKRDTLAGEAFLGIIASLLVSFGGFCILPKP
jgi:hypothetical protein